MGWLRTRFTSSFFSLFASSHPDEADSAPQCGLEDIRKSMLDLLDGMPSNALRHRVRYAIGVQGLWYLRGDLMRVLAEKLGEAAAQEKIVLLTAMFQHLLPSGLKSRPSPFSAASKNLQNSAKQERSRSRIP